MERVATPNRKLWPLTLLVLAMAPAVMGISGMQKSPAPSGDGTFYGPAQSIGNGDVRTYVNVRGGEPVEIGVALSETALDNLPMPAPQHAGHAEGASAHEHVNMVAYSLELPAEAARTPYRFVELDWNPGGHEPPGIYDIPHFDFHFYTITPAERDAIDPADPLFQKKTENVPPAGFIASNYVAPMMTAVPKMGLHWIDPASPELNGQKFTRTFIYGSWDGKATFWEPMITREFILSRPDFQTHVMQPERVATPGYYPQGYTVRWNEQTKEYRIALTELSMRSR
jgi:hypothetical protein